MSEGDDPFEDLEDAAEDREGDPFEQLEDAEDEDDHYDAHDVTPAGHRDELEEGDSPKEGEADQSSDEETGATAEEPDDPFADSDFEIREEPDVRRGEEETGPFEESGEETDDHFEQSSRPDDDHFEQSSRPDDDHFEQSSRPDDDPFEQSSRPDDYLFEQSSRPDDDPFEQPSGPDDDPFGEGGVFEEMEVDDVDPDEVWAELTDAQERGSVSELQERIYAEVSKHRYCEQCEFFSHPPDIQCSHEGTEILEFTDMEEVRVVDCPVVAERKELEEE